MIEKYMYHGMDITLDIYEKLQSVISIIAQKENKSFDECYKMFSKSRTYRNIQLTGTEMWAESAEYIVDEYYRERDLKEDRNGHNQVPQGNGAK